MVYRVGAVQRRYTIGLYPDWSALLAMREAKALRQRIDRGEDPLKDRERQEVAAADTFEAVCEAWLIREGGMTRDTDGKPTFSGKLRSAGERLRTFQKLVYPEIGKKSVYDIKRSDIVKLLDGIEGNNGPVMADRTLAYVRKVFNWHASRSDDFWSPIVRDMARTKPRERARERTLTDDELRAVWRAAEASTGPFGRLVRFILLTSARRSEAAGMAWAELNGEWTLPAARNKTKVDLIRPLADDARAALPAKVDDCQYVFTTDGKNPISGFSKFKAPFDKVAGVSDWTLHDLRRTARSLMSRAGVPTDHAERCLGHVIPGVRGVYDRYEYLEEKRDAFDRLAKLIAQIVAVPQHASAA
jgi:integrase